MNEVNIVDCHMRTRKVETFGTYISGSEYLAMLMKVIQGIFQFLETLSVMYITPNDVTEVKKGL